MLSDICLVAAGIGGMAIALVHAYLGQKLILGRITGLSKTAWRLNAVVYQVSSLYWFSGGLALSLAPFYFDAPGRFAVSVIVALVYIWGAVANFWATRGRHFGWILLAVVAVLAFLGRQATGA